MNNMNNRKLNILFTKSGSSSTSCKLSSPRPWIKALGLDEGHRSVIAPLEENKIVIFKPE